jgi:hypothetical protein
MKVAETLAMREGAISVPAASRIMASMHLLGVIIGAGLGLGGCTRIGTALTALPAGQVTVAPGVMFSMPPPAALQRSVEAQQLITARYRDETFVFETRISVTPSQMLVVGTDMLGRRAMTIEWTGNAMKVEVAPWVPPELRARNVIADIMLLYWPENAVRAGLTPAVAMQVPHPEQRVIAVDGHEMIRMDRVGGPARGWSGRWTFDNLGWGYKLDIQSVEAAP